MVHILPEKIQVPFRVAEIGLRLQDLGSHQGDFVSQRALELVQISFRVGKSDLRSMQEQQLGVHSARLALLRVQSERLSQRARLHLALGGSFEPQPPAGTETAKR